MAMTEKIRIMLVKSGNISESELARRMGTSPQNLHNKMKRDNFTESDLAEIANALNCNLKIQFISKLSPKKDSSSSIQQKKHCICLLLPFSKKTEQK